MNDTLHGLKAWRGPGKVRTLETFIRAEHFIFWTMSQFERGNDDTSDGNAQEISDFNPRLCLHGPRKTACDCAKGLCVAKTKSGRIGDEVRRGLRVI
jgi:hypothetical protein